MKKMDILKDTIYRPLVTVHTEIGQEKGVKKGGNVTEQFKIKISILLVVESLSTQ